MADLTPYFSWVEVTRSGTAKAKGIDNSLPTPLHDSVVRTAQFMECIRALLGDKPITVNSWYRCPALNVAIGGSKSSAHMKGLAVDWEPAGMELSAAFDRVAASALPFDQLILERTKDGAAWIHVGLSEGKPRREVLRAQGQTLGGPMSFTRVAIG